MSIHVVLFYLTIVLLPTQLGLHTWPDWALILGRRIDYLSPTLFLTDITIFFVLLTWVVTQKNFSIPKKQIAILCGIMLAIGLNIGFSVSPIISLYRWGKIIEFVCFGFYIYKTKPLFRNVVFAFSVAAAYSSLIGITQFFFQRSIGGVMWFFGERSFDVMTPGIARTNWCWFTNTRCGELLRPYATFPHPNVLGGYLVTTMYLIAHIAQTEKTKQIRLWLYSILGISFLTLMFTLSRSAWVIGILAAILIIMYTPRKQNKKIIISGVVVLMAYMCLTLPYFLSLNIAHESVFVRYDLAFSAIKLFFQHPLFGTGLGTFLVKLPSVALTRDLFFVQPVHNIYLLWIAETGIVGIIFLCIVIKKYILYFVSHRTSVFHFIPIMLLLMVGLVDHYPLSVQQGQLLFAILITLPFLNYHNT
ncbi:MAG: O-antigen ligase family protein [Candidatus Gottesmanbacteria bacterium]